MNKCIGLRGASLVCALAGVLLVGCGDKGEDKELTARITAQQEAQKTPEQKEADAKAAAAQAAENAKLIRMISEVRALREIAKNPKSFEFVSLMHVPKGDINCITYRATNSFNAVVTEHFAAGPDGKSKSWNAACAGQTAQDWTGRVRLKL